MVETLSAPRTSERYAQKVYDQTSLYTRRPESGGIRCSSANDDRFIGFIGSEEFRIIQDNARPHAALCVTIYLFEVGILKLDRPARNPAMNPVVHVWNMLKR
ncbi:hypothetical protein B5X24_HaOG215983 [Helicoverpa armigera]|nr:hypothetical protein B5X24_HaOG215983 [Helicoverpa armigera]